MLSTIVSYLAAFLTTISFLPQAIQTVRTRDTRSISLGMYVLFACGVTLWMAYGIITTQWPIIISNAITALFAFVILGFKIAGTRGAGRMASSESPRHRE